MAPRSKDDRPELTPKPSVPLKIKRAAQAGAAVLAVGTFGAGCGDDDAVPMIPPEDDGGIIAPMPGPLDGGADGGPDGGIIAPMPPPFDAGSDGGPDPDAG